MKTTQFLDREYISEAPLNLKNFILWVGNFLQRVPDEYKDSAEIEIDLSYGMITVSYERDETPEEEKTRIRIATDNKNRKRDLELKDLARLKAKYEGDKS